MHVERLGSGPRNFVALHGWSGDSRTFHPVLPGLPSDVSFHALDLPGCGRSAPPLEWTLRAVLDEIHGALAAVGGSITLVGNCSGANLALFAAQRAAQISSSYKIVRVVMIDAFAYWPWYFRVFVNPVFGRYAYNITFANPLGRWLTNRSLRSKRADDTSLVEGFEQVDHASTYRYLEILRSAGPAEQFRGLQVPIDIVFGQNSFAGIRASAEYFHAMWPKSSVTCLSGAGHLPIREATAHIQQLLFSTSEKEPLCTTPSTGYAR